MTNYTIHTERLNPFENDKGYTVHARLFDVYGVFVLASAHGSGDTVEAAEDKAIARAIALLRSHEAGTIDTEPKSGPQVVVTDEEVQEAVDAINEWPDERGSHIEKGTMDNTGDEPVENPSEKISVDNSEAEIDPLDGEPLNTVIEAPVVPEAEVVEEDAIVIEEPKSEEPKTPPSRSAPSFLRSNKPSFDTVGSKQSRAAKPKPVAQKIETATTEPVDPRVHEDWDKRLANGGSLIVPAKDDSEAWDATSSAVDEVVKAAKVRMTLVNFYAKNTAWFDALKAHFPGAYELTINTMSAKRQALES